MNGKCPAGDKVCSGCNKIGHFVKVCRSRKVRGNVVNTIEMDKDWSPEQYEDNSADLFVGTLQEDEKGGSKLWYPTIWLGSEDVNIKLDMGSEANLILMAVFKNLPEQQIRPATCKLVTYTGQRMQGETTININGCDVKFHVMDKGGPILGKDACVLLNMITRVEAINKCSDGGKKDSNG